MNNAPCILGDISREQFLTEYWQKKPLLIRSAIPNFEPPIDADELAGMALEEEVESRIVLNVTHYVSLSSAGFHKVAVAPMR